MFERFYSHEVRALSWNSGKERGEADGMEKTAGVHVLFHPSHLVREMGDKSVFLASVRKSVRHKYQVKRVNHKTCVIAI